MAFQNWGGWFHLEPSLHAEGRGQGIFCTQSKPSSDSLSPSLCPKSSYYVSAITENPTWLAKGGTNIFVSLVS